MNFESVLIVTYGRSGSTLLQGLLNLIPGCMVRGENYNFCYGLYQAFNSLYRSKTEFGKGNDWKQSTSAWFGCGDLNEDIFFEDCRTLLRNQLLAGERSGNFRCFGFKEIRYFDQNLFGKDKQLENYLDFLARLLPKSALLFLTREHAQVIKSAWWSKHDPKEITKNLQDFEWRMHAYSIGKPWVFHIDYGDIVNRTEHLKSMYAFLGAEYDESIVKRALTVPHSYMEGPAIQEHEAVGKASVAYELGCPAVVKVFVDKLSPQLPLGTPIDIGGVVVLKTLAENGWKLVMREDDIDRPVFWSIESPLMAKEFPGNPFAARARFKVEGVTLRRNQQYWLVLISPTGQEWKIAQISASMPQNSV